MRSRLVWYTEGDPDRTCVAAGKSTRGGASQMRTWEGRIEVNPRIMFGKPVIVGTRIPVEHILGKLASGMGIPEVLEDYRTITAEDVLAALAYARDVVGSEDIVFAGAPT